MRPAGAITVSVSLSTVSTLFRGDHFASPPLATCKNGCQVVVCLRGPKATLTPKSPGPAILTGAPPEPQPWLDPRLAWSMGKPVATDSPARRRILSERNTLKLL